MHGYQDNANTFDKLIPLLPRNYYYVCIDLPGHGKSTEIPTKTFITFMDFLLTLKFILDHFEQKTYILLGHSYGAQLWLMFTQLFPESVSKLIMLDATYFLPVNPKYCITEYRGVLEHCKKFISSNRNPPTYTQDEAVQRLRDARFSQINEQSARVIMQRSLTPGDDGKYYISTSQHLKFSPRPPLTVAYDVELLRYNPVTCPHLVIIAEDSSIIKKVSRPLLKVLERNKKYVFRVVKGNHDVHLENPERVAPIVTKFLEKNFSKL